MKGKGGKEKRGKDRKVGNIRLPPTHPVSQVLAK
jgi:hypothetical protein